jgi:hypothetical protein
MNSMKNFDALCIYGDESSPFASLQMKLKNLLSKRKCLDIDGLFYSLFGTTVDTNSSSILL